MVKSENRFPGFIYAFIRFCLGVVVGIIFFELLSIRHYMKKWLGSDFTGTDWIMVVVVLAMGLGAAVWGEKALTKFIDMTFRRKK
jgi:hypothetical protein